MGQVAGSRSLHNYEGLIERLRRFVAENQLAVGEKLPAERSLATIFGVSRSSIRTVIRTLAERGVLESRQGDGTYICGNVRDGLEYAVLFSVDSECKVFNELLEVRKIVEPAVARLAARRRTIEQLKELKVIVCDQQRCMLLEENDGDLDARFHYVLAQCTGNSFLTGIVAQINEAYKQSRAEELRPADWRQFSLYSHLRIIDAVERQDEDACEAEVKEHLATVTGSHPLAEITKKREA